MEHFERNVPPACSALDLDDGIKRNQRDAKIGGVRRDAALAPSQYGVQPVVAAAGVAARAGSAFVAGAGNVVEIGAAGPLHEIAAHGGGIAKLCGRSRQERLGDGYMSVDKSAKVKGRVIPPALIGPRCRIAW